MRILDRDLRLLMAGNLFYALGVGMYLQLLFVYAMDLGASRFTIGWLNAVMLASIAVGNIPGAWATHRFRLKTIIVVVWWLTVPAAVSFALAPSWPWLLPGLVLSGLCMANNPAFKSYIWLKSAPGQVARSVTLVFAAYPAGLVIAPLIGGFLAARYGMPTVFWLSAVMYVASSAAVSLIRDAPSQASATPRQVASTRHNRTFRRYVLFFLVGFLAVYVGQPFLNPYLAQAHGQGYAALGVFASLAAAGAALLTPIGGRVADLRGARMSAAIILGLLLVGAVLLLAGPAWPFWAAAMFLFGGFDAFRFLATGTVGRSFGSLPLPWGYALFDTVMGLPMAGGAVLGGLLFRTGSALPFVLVAVIVAGLLGVLLVWRPAPIAGARQPFAETSPKAGGTTAAGDEGPTQADAGGPMAGRAGAD